MAVKKNKSSVFILPMILGVPYDYFKGILNCYIGCNYDDRDEERIYVVFNTESIDDVKDRESVLTNNEQYFDTLIVADFTIYSFKVSSAFKDDFHCFKEGKYSKFSYKYKKILKRLYSNKWVHSVIDPKAIDREKLREKLGAIELPRNCEIFDSPYESEETFSLSHFIEVDL
jgi:hypothetical protein